MMFRSRQVLSTIQKLHFHSKSFVISDHVQTAMKNGDPIVALESTIITHGMPRPHNLKTAKRVESIIRDQVHKYVFTQKLLFFTTRILVIHLLLT